MAHTFTVYLWTSLISPVGTQAPQRLSLGPAPCGPVGHAHCLEAVAGMSASARTCPRGSSTFGSGRVSPSGEHTPAGVA
eukprot:10766032-Alexandrium_andersonii.AAC.1